MIQPVILCGGAGTRLWPESRGVRAKQFLNLTGTGSLFQQTVTRTPAGKGFAAPLILCGTAHVELVREQLGSAEAALLVEPMPRNTAAAVALAVAYADSDALLLVMPSDHVIADMEAFHDAVEKGARLAEQDWLVTFGITPDRPETGFGYIANGPALGDDGFAVDRFVEKPPLVDAEHMLAAGNYSWNAGIFLFRAGRMRDALLAQCPAIFGAAERALAAGKSSGGDHHVDAVEFAHAPSDSIDYAVMERDDRVAVVPVAMGWSDLGSWQAVHALAAKDDEGNLADHNSFLHNSRGNLVRGAEKRVTLIGIDDVAVIVDGDDILVIPLARSQDVRIAANLRSSESA